MSKVFVGVILLAAVAAIYFLIRMIIAAVKKEPVAPITRKLGIAIVAGIVGFVAFGITQTPEEKAEIKAKQEAREKAESDKRLAEEKAAEEKRHADEEAAKIEAERKAQEIENQKAVAAQKQHDTMINEITTGWNMETTDTSGDNSNLQKAATLVVKYPNYIHEATANYIDVNDAMKKPWNYYGKVVNLSGRVYSIEQLPPGHPASKFFGSDCYTAMLAVNDDVAVSMYIVGDSTGISEDSQLNVKGYIYGHAALINRMGGQLRGLSFVGFNE